MARAMSVTGPTQSASAAIGRPVEMRSVVLDERPPLAQVDTARRASA